jgi:DNA-binding CsgD family transcriptional regulator
MDVSDALPRVTKREVQVLSLLVTGYTHAAIARKLAVSPHTVDTHLRRIRLKTGARNQAHLISLALAAGISPGR